MYLIKGKKKDPDGDKPEPVKGGPQDDGDGGMFARRIIIMMKEIKQRIRDWWNSRKEK